MIILVILNHLKTENVQSELQSTNGRQVSMSSYAVYVIPVIYKNSFTFAKEMFLTGCKILKQESKKRNKNKTFHCLTL